MAQAFDLVIRGCTVMTPSGLADTSVGVRDGELAERPAGKPVKFLDTAR